MDLDDILHEIGDWDRYQHLLLWLVILPACIPCGINAFNQVFMDLVPDHWCYVPQLLSETNLTLEQRKAISLPKEGNLYSQCEYYDFNYTFGLQMGFWPYNETETVPCRYGWEYDLSNVPSSIVIDFDLVCSKSLYPTIALSSLNVGGLVGVILFGYLNDRMGRKRSYFLCLTLEIVGGICTALAPGFISWCIARFVVGLTVPAILHIPFVIGLEVVTPSKRTLVSFYSNMFYVCGLLTFSGIAYLVRTWTMLAYATALPFLAFYIYIIFLPESLRWLLTQGKIDSVIDILQQVALINRKPLLDEAIIHDDAGRGSIDFVSKEMYLQCEIENFGLTSYFCPGQKQSVPMTDGSKTTMMDLFRTPNMRMKTLIICFSWVVNETVYVGLSYYGPSMGSDPYMSFFLSSAVEIPGYISCLLLMDRWGRRLPLSVFMVFSGVASISTALLSPEAGTVTLFLYLLAKMSIAGGTLIIFQFGSELFPTEVRGVGIGLAAFLGSIGLTVIPFINYLGSNWLILPIVIMGVFSIAGGLATLRLPETLNTKLPQTVQDGEDFGISFSWWPACMDRFFQNPQRV